MMSNTKAELKWLAFRYVANELEPLELDEFEQVLMTDQTAREAVASVVRETAALRSALASRDVSLVSTSRVIWARNPTRVSFVVLGSCLSLLLAVLLVRATSSGPREIVYEVIEKDSTTAHAQLAYAWAESRHRLDELQVSDSVDVSDSLDTSLIDSLVVDIDQPLVAPSWMLAALTKQHVGFESELNTEE